jgi:NTE family protein
MIDVEVLAQSPIHLFITATNVRTGRGKVFKNDAVTPDVLLASACLPTMFQAIEIDGEAYWDGGYSGNPTLTPLIRECKSQDTILVPINPIERAGVPRSASDILNRLNEVSFNAVVLKELRMMALMRKVADPGDGEGRLWTEMRVHVVRNNIMTELGSSSKLNAEWSFFSFLRDEGRKPRRRFSTITAWIWKTLDLDIDVLLEGSERMGLIGILIALDCSSGSPTAAGAFSCLRLRPQSLRPVWPANRCSRTGRKPSWRARRNSSCSSSRFFSLARCSAS